MLASQKEAQGGRWTVGDLKKKCLRFFIYFLGGWVFSIFLFLSCLRFFLRCFLFFCFNKLFKVKKKYQIVYQDPQRDAL